MSTEAFKDFCYRVSTFDYSKMDQAMDPLVSLMEKTDRVEVKGPGTDLSFSIKGLPVSKSAGTYNIPDGEALYGEGEVGSWAFDFYPVCLLHERDKRVHGLVQLRVVEGGAPVAENLEGICRHPSGLGGCCLL